MINKWYWMLAAAISGSIVNMGFHRTEPKTTQQKLVAFYSGMAVAIFLASPIAHRFNLTEPEEVAAVTFAFACFWEKVLDVVVEMYSPIKSAMLKGKQ